MFVQGGGIGKMGRLYIFSSGGKVSKEGGGCGDIVSVKGYFARVPNGLIVKQHVGEKIGDGWVGWCRG